MNLLEKGVGRAAEPEVGALPGVAWPPLVSVARRVAGRAPRRTVRMRLALAYGALFLLCGAVLLGASYFFVVRFPFGGTVRIVPSSHGTSLGTSAIHFSSRPGRSPRAKSAPRGLGISDHAISSALHAQRADDLHTLLIWFIVALAVMAAASVLLGWLMAGRVLRPLRQITSATRQISEENLHRRLALAGPSDEITDLAGTIDGLLTRLEGAFDAERAFVANASHELRTPLAMMRTSLDVAAAKSPPISRDASVLSTKVYEGLDQAERLVESFLVLARAHRGVIDDLTTVSLADIAAEALDARAGRAAAAGVTLDRRLDGAAVVGSPTLLARLAANLIDNAIRHNRPGGWVGVATTGQGEGARLIVDNSGPVIDPAEVEHLTRPFRRGGAERTGSRGGVGLGLSIVAAISAAHHGVVDLQARPQGGLRVVVTLPRPGGTSGDRVPR